MEQIPFTQEFAGEVPKLTIDPAKQEAIREYYEGNPDAVTATEKIALKQLFDEINSLHTFWKEKFNSQKESAPGYDFQLQVSYERLKKQYSFPPDYELRDFKKFISLCYLASKRKNIV